MMRKLIVPGLAGLVLAVGVAACSGGDGDDDDSGSPTPAPLPPPYDFAITGTSFTGVQVGKRAHVRVLATSGGTVVFCGTSDTINASGVFTLAEADALPSSQPYTVEVIAHNDTADLTFTLASDLNYTFSLGTVNTNVNVLFKKPSAESNVTWTPGTQCPGT